MTGQAYDAGDGLVYVPATTSFGTPAALPAPSPHRRRAECPVCGRIFHVRLDGLLRRHGHKFWLEAVCPGSYVDCTSEETTT